MADPVVLQEFLAVLGYKIDESGQRRFQDAVSSMAGALEKLGLGIGAAVASLGVGFAHITEQAEKLYYLSQRAGETVTNINALTFSLSKLGVDPENTLRTIQSIGDALRNNLGFKSVWEAELGEGSTTEQLGRLGEKLKGASQTVKNYWHNLLKEANISEEVWLAIQRPGFSAGIREYIDNLKRYGFDPDKFAEQSVKFQNSLRDLESRIGIIWGRIAQKFVGPITDGISSIVKYMDAHAEEITSRVERVTKAFLDFGEKTVAVVRDLVNWFERLTTSQKQVIEVIGLVGLAFLHPGFLKIAVIATLLEKLITDYDTFKRTGQSDLHIPWDKLLESIQYIVDKLGELNEATGGWINAWTAIEVLIGGKVALTIIRALTAITASTAVATSGAWLFYGAWNAISFILTSVVGTIAAISRGMVSLIGTVGGLLGRFAGPLGLLAGLLIPGFNVASQEQENETTGGSLAQRYPERVITGNIPSHAEENKKAFAEFLKKLWEGVKDTIIPGARAEDLPENIKQLNQTMYDLKQVITDNFLDQMFPGAGGGSGGGGGGATRGGQKVDFNNPKSVEAVKYFMGRGYSMIEALGIVGNLLQESGLDEKAINSTGHVGVAQWDRARQARFQQMYGHPLSEASFLEQLGYVDNELQNTHRNALNAMHQAGNIQGTTKAFFDKFEIAGDASLGTRTGYAKGLMANPNITNNDTSRSANVNQTNNVTVHGASDPNDTARVMRDINDRHWADLTRNLTGAYR